MEKAKSKINLTIWVITLNVNRLYSPVRKQRLLDWINKQTYNATVRHLQYTKYTLNIKTQIGWKQKDRK